MKLMNIDEIKIQIFERGITAYKISKETNLSEVGINKILSGKSNNPRKTTIHILTEYLRSIDNNNPLENKLLGQGIRESDNEDIGKLHIKLNKLENRIDLLISSNNSLRKEVEKLNKKIYF